MALKVKFLASKPARPRKCPVLGSRIALFFDLLKMGEGHEQCHFILEPEHARGCAKQNFEDFFSGERLTIVEILRTSEQKTLFGGKHFRVVSSVLGIKHSCPWPRIVFVSLASSLVLSTPPLPSKLTFISIIFLIAIGV